VAEAADPEQALYGLARLEALLDQRGIESPKALIDAVHADVSAFVRGADASDDVTLMALRWHGART
jgi:serine phosphatase RsbU (regulator of sigma subunit)